MSLNIPQTLLEYNMGWLDVAYDCMNCVSLDSLMVQCCIMPNVSKLSLLSMFNNRKGVAPISCSAEADGRRLTLGTVCLQLMFSMVELLQTAKEKQ